jgi:hypothetical protein
LIIETKHADVTSNIPEGTGKRRQMKISAAGMAHIVGALTNNYKDPELAVIRENFTNGVDAHVRAGVSGVPIKITLPTWDKPNYVVTDTGCGMSEDDLLNVYSQYGESSKLGTNDEAGGFGIGAKSGLAIASQFTVVSVKDGMKSVGLITKGSGLPEINVLSSTPTDEPNGTIVSIPVKDIYAFNDKARGFFRYVDPSTVLVDGVKPHYALDEAEVVTNPAFPDFKAYAMINQYSYSSGASYLIMGNVPYLIPEEDVKLALGNSMANSDVTNHIMRMTKYFMVPIGSVDLVNSRESLMYTDKTNALIKDYMDKFAASIKLTAQANADAAKDFTEFFKIKKRWKYSCGWDLTFKGKQWSEEMHIGKTVRRISRSVDGSSAHVFRNTVNFDEHDKQFFVTGLKAEEYTKINGYLTPFLRKRDLDDGVFIITEATEHLTDDRTIDNPKIEIIGYEDLLKEGKEQRKLDRANGTQTKTEAKKLEYPVLVVAENQIQWIPYNEIPEGQPYAYQDESTEYLERIINAIYDSNSMYNRASTNVTRVATAVEKLTDFTHVVLIGKNRTVDAYKKRVPKSPDLNTIIRDTLVDEYKALMTDEVIEVAAYQNSNWPKILRTLGTDLTQKITDDTITSLASPADSVKEAIVKLKGMRTHISTLKYTGYSSLPDVSNIHENKIIETLNDKYPLIKALDYRYSSVPADHIVAYINSVQDINA